MKRLCCILLSVALLVTVNICYFPNVATAQVYMVEYDGEEFGYNDLERLEELRQQQDERMDAAHTMAEAARFLGYSEDSVIITSAKQDWEIAYNKKMNYQDITDNLVQRWETKAQEFAAAAYVWQYLKSCGYNDAVAAGIIGNMMVEAGGQTLDLKWNASTGYCYGGCQWNKTNYSQVWGKSLEGQCEFLESTIKYEFDTFGYSYQRGFNYNSFTQLTDVKQAALAFAKCYERCGAGTYRVRQYCAQIAYNYFVS